MKIKLIAYCLLMSSALHAMDKTEIQTYTQVGKAFKYLFSPENTDSYDQYVRLSTVAVNINSEDPECGSMCFQSKNGLQEAKAIMPKARNKQHGVLFANDKKGKPSLYMFLFSNSVWQKDPTLDENFHSTSIQSFNSATIYNISPSDNDIENNDSRDSHITWIKTFIESRSHIPLVINIQDALWQTYYPLITNIINELNINPPIFDHRLETRFRLATKGTLQYQHCFISGNNTFENLYQESFAALEAMFSQARVLNALLFYINEGKEILIARHYTTNDQRIADTITDLTKAEQEQFSCTAFIITDPSDIAFYENFLSTAQQNEQPIVLIMSKKIIDTSTLNEINGKLDKLNLNADNKITFIQGEPYFLKNTQEDASTIEKVEIKKVETKNTIPKTIKTHRSNKWYLVGGLALAFFGFLYYKYAAK